MKYRGIKRKKRKKKLYIITMKKGHPKDDRNPTQELVLIYFFDLNNLKKMFNGHSLQDIQQGVG